MNRFQFVEDHKDAYGVKRLCEVVEVARDSKVVARWGGRCGRWERLEQDKEHTERVGSG